MRRREQEPDDRHEDELDADQQDQQADELAEVDGGALGRRQQQRAERLGLALPLEGRGSSASVPENATVTQRMPAAASSIARPSRTNANAKMSTHDTAKNTVV